MRNFARRRPILTYVALTYAISWSYWIPLALRGAIVTPGGSVTHFPGLLGPAIAAFVTTALIDGWSGVRRLGARMIQVSRPVARFWIYSLSPVLLIGLALLVAAWRGPMPRMADFAIYSGLPPLALPNVLLLVLLFNGFGEEIGWRGFALRRLQSRFGGLGGAMVLALIWAGWHFPTFWTVEGYRTLGVAGLLGGFGLGICAGSIVLARVANRTGGSILAASLWHFSYNMGSATTASRGLIGAVATTGVMVWAAVLVVQEVRRKEASQALIWGSTAA